MNYIQRDIGWAGDASYISRPVLPIKHTLVYLVTHDGNGNYSDYMWRSFISFTYGGRHIEDFNLIATISGNSLNRLGSAPFNDITTTYDNLDGQLYWNSHYQANTLELTLATDGIDEKLLGDFKNWFRAGQVRELILAEHPNRGILARISEPPQLNLLPFDLQVDITITAETYHTHTTLYKGEIVLKFVMDDPYWYALDNLMGILDPNDTTRYINKWYDANGELVDIFASLDALKILYEDGIPLGSMIQKDMLLGNKAFASVESNDFSRIWDDNKEAGAKIEANDATKPYRLGTIAGAIINADGSGISSLNSITTDNNNVGYFYYSGNAPAPTIITFTMTPTFNYNGYIGCPINSKSEDINGRKYNTITIESVRKQELCFTTPNIYTSYNKAIEIFRAASINNTDLVTLVQNLREEIRHKDVREWAIRIAGFTTLTLELRIVAMQDMFKIDGTANMFPVTFSFNSENGEAIGSFKYYIYNSGKILKEVEEDVGDMLRSNYIILRDRNVPTSDGYIKEWTQASPQNSHRIYHDVDVPLSNIQVEYKNMYF